MECEMQRRNFIRLLGGGVVAAAAGPLAGCSSDFPDIAIAPWKGPAEGGDVRRWALAYAILAPNSHNRQPWIADLRDPDAITLHVDLERTLPMTDPWFRQIVVSQGTFLESLLIALRQRDLEPHLQLFPKGEFAPRAVDDRPVARVSWPHGASAPPRDPLFAQLLRRQTAKVDYDVASPVPAAVLAELQAALVDPGVHFGGTVEAARLRPLRQLCLDSARVEMATQRTALESLELMRIGPDEIAQHRDGISMNGLMPRMLAALGAFDRSGAPAEGSLAFKQTLARFEGHSRSAMGFVWLSTTSAEHARAGTQRSAEVRAGRAYMRLQLKATELGLQMHPMSQAPQEFPEMKHHHERLHELLLGQPASVETVQMFCRIGYCEPQQHTPRRGVEAIVRV